MTAERWRQIEELYHVALQLPLPQRAAYLDDACRGDDDLRAELEALLANSDVSATIRPSQLTTFQPSQMTAGSLHLERGTLVAGRFRIEGEIAAGGMGIVYRAIDEKLNQPRALKVAKHGFAAHLSPEAQTAMRITHRNVCRLFEIHTANTPDGPLDFLSMELIEGGTLGQYLKSHGPFTGAAALDIAEQICTGITAAHSQKLLHRDLKSSNILIEQKLKQPMRAVVTDFGLAHESRVPSDSGVATDATVLAGTPAYMAPERWKGKPSSVQTDIFALGMILHEIVTGHMPAGGGEAPREIDPAVPARWRRVIAQCLEADPAKRFSSAADLPEALSGRAVRRRRKWIAAAAAVPATAVIVWRLMLPAVTPPARLAVLPIDVPGGDAATTAQVRAAGLDLSSRLARMRPRPPQLVVIPIEETQSVPSGQAGVAKQRLGASHILRATATRAGNHVLLHGEIVNTTTNVTLRETSAEIASAGEIPSRLATLVAAAFNLPRQTPAETVSAAAWPDYAGGLNSLLAHQYKAAITSFEKAAKLDPGSPVPEARLAEACFDAWELTSDPMWLERGRQQVARAAAMSPDSLAVHLAAGKLNLEPGSWQRAVEEYQRATQLDPASAEAWGGLAHAYEGMEGRQADAANAYLKAVDVQPGYFAAFSNLAIFQRRLGNYDEAEKYFRKAVELAPQAPLLHANLGGLYEEMGRDKDAERELTQALALDSRMMAVLNNLGALYQYQGRDHDAVAVFERARAIGPDSYILALNLGDSYRRLGKTQAAAEAYGRGRKLAETRLVTNPGDAATRAYLAYFAMRLGDRTTGEREISQALYFAPGSGTVVRRAVLYFEALHQPDKAFGILQTAAPDVVREINRHPDLAAFRHDPRFIALLPKPK